MAKNLQAASSSATEPAVEEQRVTSSSDEDYEIPSAIEDIVELLISGLRDKVLKNNEKTC